MDDVGPPPPEAAEKPLFPAFAVTKRRCGRAMREVRDLAQLNGLLKRRVQGFLPWCFIDAIGCRKPGNRAAPMRLAPIFPVFMLEVC